MSPRGAAVTTKRVAKGTAGTIHQRSQQEKPFLPELQQTILNVFHNAFSLADANNLTAVIQQVKGHLYNRDFSSAFGQPDFLQAYALRWSAARALGYAEIFSSLSDIEPGWENTASTSVQGTDRESNARSPRESPRKVVCIGGGAGAEVVGLAAVAQALSTSPRWEVTAIDIANWSNILSSLETSLCTPPPISAYASAFAKTGNKPLIEQERLSLQFLHRDVLRLDENELGEILAVTSLCTMMFTLNELFTSSISRTTAFLLALSEAFPPGALLLVVDSPGSYSEIKLGQQQTTKQYPMKWLLDHTLLEIIGTNADGTSKWKKLMSDDSRWFRIPSQLRYPIDLENMRYQIHLYKKQ